MLEPLVYRLEGEAEDAYAAAYAGLVVEGARALAGSGADLLKLQFPSEAACRELTGGVLTLAVGAPRRQATWTARRSWASSSSRAGPGPRGSSPAASVWGGALGLPAGEQEAWLHDEALPLFERMCATAEELAAGIPH